MISSTGKDNILLVDLSGICVALGCTITSDEDEYKQAVYRCIRKLNKIWGKEYPKMIICADHKGGTLWRKKRFQHYKARRAAARAQSKIDFVKLHKWQADVTQDLKNNLPIPIVEVPDCEADDTIAVITKMAVNGGRKVMISSADKDFVQLQRYEGVRQYLPRYDQVLDFTRKEALVATFNLICKGDVSDGVPNILSPETTFITEGARQTTLRQKVIDGWLSNYKNLEEEMDEEVYKRFILNTEMISFTKIPEYIKEKIQGHLITAKAAVVHNDHLLQEYLEEIGDTYCTADDFKNLTR